MSEMRKAEADTRVALALERVAASMEEVARVQVQLLEAMHRGNSLKAMELGLLYEW